MSDIIQELPEVRVRAERPSKCPSCGGEILQRWGRNMRQVRDTQVGEVEVYRYRCCGYRGSATEG